MFGEKIILVNWELEILIQARDLRTDWFHLVLEHTSSGPSIPDSSQIPILLKTIRDQGVKYVDMGEDHSVALTHDGGVFSWGQGGHGQLGHGTISCQNTPRKVFELMGNRTISLACGRKHTLVLTSTRSVFGFGLNCNNQLGPSHENSIRLPQSYGPFRGIIFYIP